MMSLESRRKIVSFATLLVICIIALIISLWPTYYVSSHSDIGLEGVFFIFLQELLPLVFLLISVGIYRLLQDYFKLFKFSTFVTVLVPILFLLPATQTLTLILPMVYRIKDRTVKNSFDVQIQIIKEDIVPVHSLIGDPQIPGVNPFLYEYVYTINLNNLSSITFEDTPMRISIGYNASDKLWNFDMISLMSQNNITKTIVPGENIISGKFPIVFFDVSNKRPGRDQIYLEVYAKIYKQNNKSIITPSTLDWVNIYQEQQDFWRKNTTRKM